MIDKAPAVACDTLDIPAFLDRRTPQQRKSWDEWAKKIKAAKDQKST